MQIGKHALACTAAIVLSTIAAQAESITEKTQRKEAEIPTCSRNLGTIAVREPQTNWWDALGLASPEALLKVFVRKSGCFTLLDRGKGFELIQQERALASGGALRQGSGIGAGQLKAADYILVPDIASKNANANGANIGGIIGGLVGGTFGALLSVINIHSSTADVVLTIDNVRTGEEGPVEQGHASKTDIGFGAGGGLGSWGGFGGAAVSSYQSTDIGQVVTLAYIDSYTKLVSEMGGLSANAVATAPAQAVTMTRPGRMYVTPSVKAKIVRALEAGMMLYPTGNKDGVWWEVKDELGNQGWVSSIAFDLAK